MKRESVLNIYYRNLTAQEDHIAVTDLFDEITYGELERISNNMCLLLEKAGARPNEIIPVCVENCVERTIAVLAIIKCCAAYILVDPTEWERKSALLCGFNSSNLVIGEIQSKSLFSQKWTLVTVEDAYACPDAPRSEHGPSENELFCAHFTSGTTGIPQIVYLQHFDAYDMICARQRSMDECQVSIVAQYLSPGFAFGMEGLISALALGKTMLYPEEISKGNIVEMFRYFQDNGVDMVDLPSSLINTIAHNDFFLNMLPDNLRLINIGGESIYLTERLMKVLERKQITLCSTYGSAETFATFFGHVENSKIRKANSQIPLGSIVNGCSYFIKDRKLCISRNGKKLLDYHERRRSNGKWSLEGVECADAYFDTMDIVALEDGNLFIKGRANRCVKIRGYSVCLDEIEYCIRAVVPDADFFVGYAESSDHVSKVGIVFQSGGRLSVQQIKNIVRDALEEYKCPQIFVEVETIPRNKNGKRDSLLCSALLQKQLKAMDTDTARSKIDKYVACAVQQYTGTLSEEQYQNNFSDLGIDSLTLIAILCKIEEYSGMEIPLENLDLRWIDTPERLAQCLNGNLV